MATDNTEIVSYAGIGGGITRKRDPQKNMQEDHTKCLDEKDEVI